MREDRRLVDPEALRRSREAAGLTQDGVARSLGLTGGLAVYNWERGKHVPRDEFVPVLAGLFGVETRELLIDGPRDLRWLRVAAGVPVAGAAVAVGVSTRTYRRWERGVTQRGPNRAEVAALAGLFGVPVAVVEAAVQEARVTGDGEIAREE